MNKIGNPTGEKKKKITKVKNRNEDKEGMLGGRVRSDVGLEGYIYELQPDVLHSLVDATNSRLYTVCSGLFALPLEWIILLTVFSMIFLFENISFKSILVCVLSPIEYLLELLCLFFSFIEKTFHKI